MPVLGGLQREYENEDLVLELKHSGPPDVQNGSAMGMSMACRFCIIASELRFNRHSNSPTSGRSSRFLSKRQIVAEGPGFRLIPL